VRIDRFSNRVDAPSAGFGARSGRRERDRLPAPGGPAPRLTVGTDNGRPVEIHHEDHGAGRPVVLVHGTARVRRAALAAAVPPYLHRSDDDPDGGLDDATIEQFQAGVVTDRLAFLDGFTKDFFTPGGSSLLRSPAVSEPQRQYALQIAAFASPKGTLDCITAFGRTDFRADVAAVTVPTLVIHGDSDAIVPFEVSGKRAHEAIAGSELVVIEGGPHGVNASHAEEFNRALIGFLGR
jgi:non-heme chloroperoxidase